MSEENQESGLSTLKKTLIGVLTTAITGAGVYITTHINQLFGVEDEEEKTEQVQQAAQPAAQAPIILNIDNSATNNANASSGGGTTIIKETVREVPVQQPVVEEPKEETPIERMKRLKAEKAKQDGQ